MNAFSHYVSEKLAHYGTVSSIRERGLMHAKQIIERYEAPEAQFAHTVLLITINRSVTERESIYAAVRYAWKLDPDKARQAQFVLAVQQGLIVGVFVAEM